MNEEWSNDQKKKIDCNNPKGFSQKAHCAGRKKRQAGKQTKSKPVKEFMEKKTIEERLQLFLEKNVPTSPSKWSYWVGQAKKKFDVYPSALRKWLGLPKCTKVQVASGKQNKEVNFFVKVYLFFKELIIPSRKPRNLEINWILMKLDAEIQPLPTSKSNEKTMVDMGKNG